MLNIHVFLNSSQKDFMSCDYIVWRHISSNAINVIFFKVICRHPEKFHQTRFEKFKALLK